MASKAAMDAETGFHLTLMHGWSKLHPAQLLMFVWGLGWGRSQWDLVGCSSDWKSARWDLSYLVFLYVSHNICCLGGWVGKVTPPEMRSHRKQLARF